jgi:hypothetical protein
MSRSGPPSITSKSRRTRRADLIQRDRRFFETVAGAQNGTQLEDQEDRDPGKDQELDQGLRCSWWSAVHGLP